MRSARIAPALVAVALLGAGCGSEEPAASPPAETEAAGTALGGTALGGTAGTAVGGTATAAPPKCESVGNSNIADRTVQVRLDEWTITPAPATSEAGRIHFELGNVGEDPHELVIVKTDDPDALPTGSDGAVEQERLPDGAFIGEVEPFPAGGTCRGTFDLKPGRYALFCNIVETENGTVESHYREGMRAPFTVT
jgi:hypothetical protein